MSRRRYVGLRSTPATRRVTVASTCSSPLPVEQPRNEHRFFAALRFRAFGVTFRLVIMPLTNRRSLMCRFEQSRRLELSTMTQINAARPTPEPFPKGALPRPRHCQIQNFHRPLPWVWLQLRLANTWATP